MKGIISIGEALIDFTPLDKKNKYFRKNPGGAPANVAVGLSRLGVDASFVGKVGDDVLGTFMLQKLSEEGVNTDNMILTNEARTALTFVTLDEKGNRSFNFYINPSADKFLKPKEISDNIFKENKILHFGSISLIDEPVRSATKYAVKKAKKEGLLISYDPNLRTSLWSSLEEAREKITSMLIQTDILKVTKEELDFISGKNDIKSGIEYIKFEYEIPLVFVTNGGEGAYYYKEKLGFVPSMDADVVDTTGAGDGFVSGVLYNINNFEKKISKLNAGDLQNITKFANVSGGLVTSEKGAMAALPTLKEIKEKINSVDNITTIL